MFRKTVHLFCLVPYDVYVLLLINCYNLLTLALLFLYPLADDPTAPYGV